jgi:hypothetical protein
LMLLRRAVPLPEQHSTCVARTPYMVCVQGRHKYADMCFWLRPPCIALQAWADNAMQRSDAFDAGATGACLESAAQAGVALPRRLVVELVGTLLEQKAPRPIPGKQASSGKR